jgi:hypothetical protein
VLERSRAWEKVQAETIGRDVEVNPEIETINRFAARLSWAL